MSGFDLDARINLHSGRHLLSKKHLALRAQWRGSLTVPRTQKLVFSILISSSGSNKCDQLLCKGRRHFYSHQGILWINHHHGTQTCGAVSHGQATWDQTKKKPCENLWRPSTSRTQHAALLSAGESISCADVSSERCVLEAWWIVGFCLSCSIMRSQHVSRSIKKVWCYFFFFEACLVPFEVSWLWVFSAGTARCCAEMWRNWQEQNITELLMCTHSWDLQVRTWPVSFADSPTELHR